MALSIQKKINKNASAVDNEWEKFISHNHNNQAIDSDEDDNCLNEDNDDNSLNHGSIMNEEHVYNNTESPKATEIYISTKSKIAYLDKNIDLKDIFWKIPIIPYSTPVNGVIKKQMKFNSDTQEDLDIVHTNLKLQPYYDDQVMTSINNPNGRIKFKDIRKISIGISKKIL